MNHIHILMVEDDPGDAFLIREALDRSGLDFTLHHTDHGEKALDFLYRRGSYQTARRPDLILLDLNLPCLSGVEVLREVKSASELSAIPVIVLTTSKSETDANLCLRLGAGAFFSKASSFVELLAVGEMIERFCWRGPCS